MFPIIAQYTWYHMARPLNDVSSVFNQMPIHVWISCMFEKKFITRISKPCVYITQINSQTFLSSKCLGLSHPAVPFFCQWWRFSSIIGDNLLWLMSIPAIFMSCVHVFCNINMTDLCFLLSLLSAYLMSIPAICTQTTLAFSIGDHYNVSFISY